MVPHFWTNGGPSNYSNERQIMDPKDVFNPNEDIPLDINFEDDSTPIQQSKNILFNFKVTKSYIGGYIDDLITIIVENQISVLQLMKQ